MASFNQVAIAGVLGRDPEVRYTAGGTAVCELSLAISHKWFDKNANEKREETTWVSVTLWGRTAEIAGEYLTKGKSALIGGRLKEDTWTDKETGAKRSKLKVVGETLQLIGGGNRSSEDQRPASDSYGEESQTGTTTPDPTFESDSLPF